MIIFYVTFCFGLDITFCTTCSLGGATPLLGGTTPALGGMTPGQTPVRDQLSINEGPNEGFDGENYQGQVCCVLQHYVTVFYIPSFVSDGL